MMMDDVSWSLQSLRSLPGIRTGPPSLESGLVPIDMVMAYRPPEPCDSCDSSCFRIGYHRNSSDPSHHEQISMFFEYPHWCLKKSFEWTNSSLFKNRGSSTILRLQFFSIQCHLSQELILWIFFVVLLCLHCSCIVLSHEHSDEFKVKHHGNTWVTWGAV